MAPTGSRSEIRRGRTSSLAQSFAVHPGTWTRRSLPQKLRSRRGPHSPSRSAPASSKRRLRAWKRTSIAVPRFSSARTASRSRRRAASSWPCRNGSKWRSTMRRNSTRSGPTRPRTAGPSCSVGPMAWSCRSCRGTRLMCSPSPRSSPRFSREIAWPSSHPKRAPCSY
jgi:hypothetical protein